MPRYVSFVVLTVILLILGYMTFEVMAGFLLPMFLAVLLVVVFRPVHLRLVEHCHGYNRVAAGLTTLVILLIVLIPLVLMSINAAVEAVGIVGAIDREQLSARLAEFKGELGFQPPSPEMNLAMREIEGAIARLEQLSLDPTADYGPILEVLEERLRKVRDEVNANSNFPEEATESIAEVQQELEALATRRPAPTSSDYTLYVSRVISAYHDFRTDLAGGPLMAWLDLGMGDGSRAGSLWRLIAAPAALSAQFLGNFLSFIIGFFVMIVAMYYFLADGPAMTEATMKALPLDIRHQRQLLDQFTSLSRAVVVAVVLSAVVQGLLAGVGYWFAGLESVFFLTMLTMLLAMVPFVGAAAVWAGCAIWLYYSGHTVAAVALSVYGAVIVSGADNVIKPLVLHGRSNLHPLLALLSVLGGVQALGPIGIFVGPMVVAFVQALLTMVKGELDEMSKDNGVAVSPSIPPGRTV